MTIVFATNNKHKIDEVRQLLEPKFKVVTLAECGITEDIEESATTLEGNALIKARYIFERTGLSCFADDTGLEVEALDGAPGVRSARYATDGHDFKANNELLLSNLKGVEHRQAQFRTAVAYIDEKGAEHLFEGIVKGVIATDYMGDQGFGYDPIFVPEDGTGESFAQMTLEQKGAISHRGRAVRKLVEFLLK